MTSKKLIYALVDPRTNEVRYIGRSSSGLARPKQHFNLRRLEDNTHKNNWIKSLLALGMKPDIRILHEFSDDAHDAELNSSEVYLIQWHRALGARLTNATDGGDGILGWKHSEEARSKISRAHTGKKRSEETRARISEAHKGKKRSVEHRANISKVKKGKLGYKPTPEVIAKRSKSLTGKHHTAETKSKLRDQRQRLTPGQAEVVKFLVENSSRTQTSLAKHFKVSDTTISYIINGKRYNP